MHVLLIGLRASGKTTLGRSLASLAQRPFLDLDDITAVLMNAPTAAAAIAKQGLSAFRLAETQALCQALSSPHPSIIALGGGTPTAPGAAEIIHSATTKNAALTIYLRAQPHTLQTRLHHTDTTTRPSLTGVSVIDEVPTLFAQRDDLYRSLATRIIDIDTMDQPQALASLALLASRAT
jgi:shikimate kinase